MSQNASSVDMLTGTVAVVVSRDAVVFAGAVVVVVVVCVHHHCCHSHFINSLTLSHSLVFVVSSLSLLS